MKEKKKMINEENLKNTRHSQARSPRIPSFANTHSSAAWFAVLNEFRCHTDCASTSTLCRKSAFSLLEKALRLNPLTALLRSRLSRFSLPERRFACSSAFSLAEVMVLLTVIAIMMALAAPMLSGPANNNSDTVKKIDNNNFTIANGKFIRLQIGTDENSNNTKLNVNGNTVINNRLKVGDFILNNDNLYILKDDTSDEIGNATLKIEILNDGTAQINLPSNNLDTGSAYISGDIPSGGYMLGEIEINSSDDVEVEEPTPEPSPSIVEEPPTSIQVNYTTGGIPKAIEQYPRIIPIPGDTRVKCTSGNCKFFTIKKITVNSESQQSSGSDIFQPGINNDNNSSQ